MIKKNEVSARKAWVKPTVNTLDIGQTLNGNFQFGGEGVFIGRRGSFNVSPSGTSPIPL